MNQDILRTEVRILKATKNMKYNEVATKLGIKTSSMYNWLKGQYSLSYDKTSTLQKLIETEKE